MKPLKTVWGYDDVLGYFDWKGGARQRAPRPRPWRTDGDEERHRGGEEQMAKMRNRKATGKDKKRKEPPSINPADQAGAKQKTIAL